MLKKDTIINNISTTKDDFYTNNNNKNIDFYNFFENKTEKLVTAIYMITNFLSDKEPMKWKFRETGLLLLNHSLTLNEKSEQNYLDSVIRILSFINEILSILEIAYLSGFISEMNYSILKREYLFVKKHIQSKTENPTTNNSFTFPENFFSVSKNNISSRSDNNKNIHHNILKKNSENNVSNSLKIKPTESYYVKNTIGQNNQKDIHNTKRQTDFVKDKRKQLILQLLRDNKELTIKDISLQVSGCSEKTIQRDLVSMLQNKVLKKTGERRWSRYSLL